MKYYEERKKEQKRKKIRKEVCIYVQIRVWKRSVFFGMTLSKHNW